MLHFKFSSIISKAPTIQLQKFIAEIKHQIELIEIELLQSSPNN